MEINVLRYFDLKAQCVYNIVGGNSNIAKTIKTINDEKSDY